MKSLSATLQTLTQARVLAEVPIILIRPVTDHSVPDLEDPELASTYPMVRTLVGVEASNAPFLQSVTFPLETMSHIPSPVGGAVDSLTRRIRFSLINRPYRGFASYFDYLTRDAPLDRADLELQLVTVPPRELGTDPAHLNRLDFQGASGGEETEVFSGRLERVISVSDTIECEGKSTLPVVPWKLVPDAGTAPRDRGLRLPIALGQKGITKCVNLAQGAEGATDAVVSIADVAVNIGFESGTFPSSGSAMLGAEAVSWSGRSGNILTGVTRGELATTVANHVVGTALIERSEIVMAVSSIPITAVTGLFVRSLSTGGIIKVPDLLYAVTYDDEANLPGSSGDGITTVTISAAQLAVVVSSALADAAVTVQADYADSAPAVSTDTDATIVADHAEVANTSGALGNWTAETTDPKWTLDSGGTRSVLRTLFTDRLTGTAKARLKTAQFGFDIDVTTLTGTTLTVGLEISGAEAALVNCPDGTIVASIEITATGAVTVVGPEFQGGAEGTVGDLYDVTLDVVHGEASGGSPTVEFNIDATRVTVVHFTDSVVSAQKEVVWEHSFGSTTSEIAPYWGGPWAGEAGQDALLEVTRDDAAARGGWTHTQTTDSLDGDPFEGASMVDSAGEPFIRARWSEASGATNSSANVDFEYEAIGDWSTVSDKPSLVTVSANADTVNNFSADIELLNVKRNLRSKDLIGTGFDFRVKGATDGDEFDTIRISIRTNFAVPDPAFGLDERVTDSEIQAAAGALDLEFFAAFDGPDAPDGTYDVSSGDLMTHPSDLIRFWLQEVGGIAAADVDDTTFDAAVTNLIGYEWGFDARNLGDTWEAILLRMGYESRANIVKPSDIKWKMLTANTSFSFGSAVATVDSTEKMAEIHKDDRETRSRLVVYFAFDPRFEGLNNRSFLQVQTTDPLDADVIAVEEEFGRNDSEPYFLFAHNGENAAGVTDWRLYMEQELGRDARLFAGRVDHWQSYPLEIGDVVSLVTTSGTTKTRVLESRRDQRQGFVMRFVEVL